MDTVTSIEVAINGRFLEGVAASEIYPGMLVKHSLTSEFDPIFVLPDVSESILPLIAIENCSSGKNITVPYTIGNIVYVRHCLPGDVFWGHVVGPPFTAPLEIAQLVQSYGGGLLFSMVGQQIPNDRIIVGKILLVGGPSDVMEGAVWCKIERR